MKILIDNRTKLNNEEIGILIDDLQEREKSKAEAECFAADFHGGHYFGSCGRLFSVTVHPDAINKF